MVSKSLANENDEAECYQSYTPAKYNHATKSAPNIAVSEPQKIQVSGTAALSNWLGGKHLHNDFQTNLMAKFVGPLHRRGAVGSAWFQR